MEIDNTLAFCEEVLQRKNLPEILNVKTMIEERLHELSLTMDLDNLPMLDSSRVKYVPSDFEFPTYAPGKLFISNTEPLKSVAEGIPGLTESRVGDLCTFTIITKDSSGITTYFEIDEVKIAIKLKSQQAIENLEPINSEDGRYSVSYTPRTHGDYAVAININGIPIKGSPFTLEVMEKMEDGGGHLDHMALPTRSDRSGGGGGHWIKSDESCTTSGIFRQVQQTCTFLEKGLYLANEIKVVSDPEMKDEAATSLPRKDRASQSFKDQNDVERDVNQDHMALPTRDQVNARIRRAEELDTDQGAPSKSHSFEIQSFEVQPKIVKVIVAAHKEELDKIETKCRVEVPRKAEGHKMALRPMYACSAEDYQKACDLFITLYQKTSQLFKVERISIKRVPKTRDARQAMKKLEKEFPVSIEKSKDQKQWEMYGEAGHIEKALSFLNKQGVEIERESKNDKSGSGLNGKDARSQGDEGALYRGGTEYPRGATSPGAGRLEIYHECPTCLTSISNPRSLKCKHVFCSVCIETALTVRNKCPVCQEPQGVLKGYQPPGQMTITRDSWKSLPGYEGYGTIIIDYKFPSGVQDRDHPNPGQYYNGTHCQAYLPDTREGREVLQLLIRAFDARLVFTVGTSTTSGLPNQITWNDIHHKTSRHGGPFGFGYPDPDYLRRVKEELAAKGIH